MPPTAIKQGKTGRRSLNAGLLTEIDATFQPLTGNTFTVATLPAAASHVGRVVYVSNGSAGSPSAAISNGTNWKVIALGANAPAS